MLLLMDRKYLHMESQADGPNNWLDVLQQLADGAYARDEQVKAVERWASDWPTCACGHLCVKLPKRESGAPADEILRSFGISFMVAVDVQDWEWALAKFMAIEERSRYLLELGYQEELP